ncbi:MAG: hypothetical protein ACRDEB_01475, partial [Chitinophagaceae bacterium]
MTHMIHKGFTILILLIFCCFISYSQVDKTKETSSILEQQKEKKRFIKEQAILLLKTSLLGSKSIENFRQRTDVIAEASTTLWDYDQSFARESLLDFINQLLADYKEFLSKENRTKEENTTLRNLEYALKQTLKALAVKDLGKAKSLQDELFEIREQSLNGKKLNERLELASEGLDFDEQRTLNLLSAIIQQGIPSQFPKLIFDLRAKNPTIAKILTQRAIQNLAVNPNYKALDAIYLSVIIFNETMILIPSLNDDSNPNNFGVFTYFIGNSSNQPEMELILGYFSSVRNFLNSKLQNQANDFFNSRQNQIKYYFLIEKLKSYNQIYNLNNSEALGSFSIQIAALMQTVGFSQQTLSDVRGYAQRLATSNNPLGIDDGTDLLEKAENAKTLEEKMDYLIRGIIQLIEFKQFFKAERKIFDITNIEIRDSLYLLVDYRAGLDSIKNKDWNEFERRTEKITEKRIKAFLYLKAISNFKSVKNNDGLLAEYVIKAEKNIQNVSDETAKAGAYIYLASLLLALEKKDGILILPSAVKSINDATDYDEDKFEIIIKIPTRQTSYADFLG